jgi:hypothetical protein
VLKSTVEGGGRIGELDVKRFEYAIGHELPADYRQFLLVHNGGRPQPPGFTLPLDGELLDWAIQFFFSVDDSVNTCRLDWVWYELHQTRPPTYSRLLGMITAPLSTWDSKEALRARSTSALLPLMANRFYQGLLPTRFPTFSRSSVSESAFTRPHWMNCGRTHQFPYTSSLALKANANPGSHLIQAVPRVAALRQCSPYLAKLADYFHRRGMGYHHGTFWET